MTNETAIAAGDTSQDTLGKVRSYQQPCDSTNEFDECPEFAVFDIDFSTAIKIVGLARVVSENGLLDCRMSDYRTRWVCYLGEDVDGVGDGSPDPGDGTPDIALEMRTDYDCLVVGRDEFSFECYLKFHDEKTTCESASIAELAEFFGIP